ncbi:hypothetical protein J437_LFUL010200 [Ladona fulva]|uniref:Uncharacterized protein n=1 Tax=Ladona fulva TaxID=123851 RepID=A0A8K0KA60_LADFU|nr:hypothetical protein J437_LFUL010200 [Ladona fulva]
MSVAASGRNRMVVKSSTRAAKGAAVRRRCRRRVVWLLHEIEDSRISTTTDNNAVSTATKDFEEECENGNYSAEDCDYSDMEEDVDSRFGRLSESLEGHKKPGGLLGITMRTVELIRRNQLLQWRLSLLQEETRAFVKSVMNNPENRRVEEGKDNEIKDNVSDGAQDPSVSGSC